MEHSTDTRHRLTCVSCMLEHVKQRQDVDDEDTYEPEEQDCGDDK